MKKAIVAIFICLSAVTHAQNKPDSLEVIKENHFIDSMNKHALFSEFQQFAYKNASAEMYNALIRIYQAYLNETYGRMSSDSTSKQKKK